MMMTKLSSTELRQQDIQQRDVNTDDFPSLQKSSLEETLRSFLSSEEHLRLISIALANELHVSPLLSVVKSSFSQD